MPKKIDFTVVYVTDEDPKHKATELNHHTPTVRGWQSARNCRYPQEIVLRLATRCSLSKIQMLAHQYLIPSKIELFSNNEDTDTSADPTNINWHYLGYITLSDNQSTGFKSRELKSVNVPKCEAFFIKLKSHNNHSNSYNIYDQVSLIAINVLGMDIGPITPENVSNDRLKAILNDPDYSSPYDDLSFEMYVDTEVVTMVKDMEMKKHLAVLDERFEYARKLKQAMEYLREAGEKLCKYELEKRHAIEYEDYERANYKKGQMDDFRSYVYRQCNIDQLLEKNGVCTKNDESADEADNRNFMSPTSLKVAERRSASPSPNHFGHQVQPSPLHHTKQSPKSGSPNIGSPTSFQNRGSFRRRNKSAGAIIKSTYEQYEDKPLPALRHSQTNEFLRECQMDYDHKQSSKLTEREKKQAALPILVFGNDLVEKFYSKHYLDKEEGLNKLKEELSGYDNTRVHTANKTGRAAVFLLHRALRDKVFSVYSLANEVIRLYFVHFISGRVSQTEVARSVDKLLPELLTKSGDTSPRINHMAVHTILTMADCNNVRELNLIPVHLSRTVNSSTHPRLALSRAEMVEQLILSHGISSDKQSGLTCRTLSEFGSSGLHHPAETVRKVAERILVLVYKVNPRLVRKQLPPDDDITRRNLLYRQLFHEFDKIDLQRKKELLEKNHAAQLGMVNDKVTCPSPEAEFKISTTKYHSSINNNDSIQNGKDCNDSQAKNFHLTKSYSGSNVQYSCRQGGTIEHSASSASGISTPSNNSQKEDDEKRCIFCNQSEDDIFAVSNSMNSHYWRSCPMLVRCKDCSQVVEVSALTDHLLTECENRKSYIKCSQCTEAVKSNLQSEHSLICTELLNNCTRCPLCHGDVKNEVNAWRIHLIGEKSCPKNPRKRPGKQVTIKA